MLVDRPKIEVAPRRKLAVAGAAVAAVVFLVGGAVGVRALASSTLVRPLTAPRPATLSTLVDAEWTAGGVGDCLLQVPDTHELEVVSCDQPHDLQRFAAGTVTDDRSVVDQRCSEAFEGFVGRSSVDSPLDIAQTRPSAVSWDQGDRHFECFLGVEGSRLTSDARSTGWLAPWGNKGGGVATAGRSGGRAPKRSGGGELGGECGAACCDPSPKKVVETGVDPVTPRFSGGLLCQLSYST